MENQTATDNNKYQNNELDDSPDESLWEELCSTDDDDLDYLSNTNSNSNLYQVKNFDVSTSADAFIKTVCRLFSVKCHFHENVLVHGEGACHSWIYKVYVGRQAEI